MCYGEGKTPVSAVGASPYSTYSDGGWSTNYATYTAYITCKLCGGTGKTNGGTNQATPNTKTGENRMPTEKYTFPSGIDWNNLIGIQRDGYFEYVPMSIPKSYKYQMVFYGDFTPFYIDGNWKMVMFKEHAKMWVEIGQITQSSNPAYMWSLYNSQNGVSLFVSSQYYIFDSYGKCLGYLKKAN